MRLETKAVVLKPRLLLAQMYEDDLNTIVHEFTEEDRGFMLPGERNYLWHTFQYVITPDKWGWVTTDALQVLPGEGDP